jgi:hypothetical protein
MGVSHLCTGTTWSPAVPLPWKPASTNGEATARLLKAIGSPEARSVAHRPFGEPSRSYWNVAELLPQHGGSLVMGWRLEIWRWLMIRASHHAIWRRPDGLEIDVTPAPHLAFQPDDITFADDTDEARRNFDLKFPIHPEDVVAPLSREQAQVAWYAAYRMASRLEREQVSLLQRADPSWTHGRQASITDRHLIREIQRNRAEYWLACRRMADEERVLQQRYPY